MNSNDKKQNDIFMKVHVSLFKSGIAKDLKATRCMTLLAIASFMDEKGYCYPTQRQLAEYTGIHKNTITKAVKELLEYRVNGQPILSRAIVKKGSYVSSAYTVHPISQVAIFSGNVEAIEKADPEAEGAAVTVPTNSPVVSIETSNPKDQLNNFTPVPNSGGTPSQKVSTPVTTNGTAPSHQVGLNKTNNQLTKAIKQEPSEKKMFNTSKDIIDYFAEKYRTVYGVNPDTNHNRDDKLIEQTGWIGNLSDSDIRNMIDTVVSEYDDRWKKPQYPRPTIFGMANWIGGVALEIYNEKNKEFNELMEMTANVDAEMDAVLAKFGIE